MTTEVKEGITRFNCDQKGCKKNYESDEEFRAAWVEANDSGWVNSHSGANGWRHYCPDHKHIVGD